MSTEYRTDVNALKKLMIDMDVPNITALAVKSGVDRNTCSKILKGEINPSSAVMFKFAAALNMDSKTAGAVFFAQDLRNA